MKKMKSFVFALMVAGLLFPSLSSALPVTTELLLLVDVSGSINSGEFALQRSGYEAAFRDAGVIDAIENSGGIAVCMVYWSTNQAIAVDWTHIYDSVSSNEFADLIAATPRSSVGGSTYLARAMDYGAGLFGDNGYEGDRLVVDISGDGRDNGGRNIPASRDNLVAAGVDMINALWIQDSSLVDYGVENVIYGEGSFSWGVNSFEEFQSAITEKIRIEIQHPEPAPAPVPEASTIALLSAGLVGLGVISRKKIKRNRTDS